MTAITDARAAIIAILTADVVVAAQVGTRVFGDELPQAETDNMPRKCVVVAPAGGTPPGFAQGTLPLEAQTIDTLCYGATLYEAEEVRRAVYAAMVGIERVVKSSVMVHCAAVSGAVMEGRDGDAYWPYKLNGWTVITDTRQVS